MENLKQIYQNRLVFIDTCCCIENRKGFQAFILASVPHLKATNSRIHVAYKCIEELGKIHKDHARESYKRDAAYDALKIYHYLQEKQLLDVKGRETDSFADSVMLQNLLRYITRYNLLLLTQDKGLACDAEMLNHLKSVKSKKNILVRAIDVNGNLAELDLKEKGETAYAYE